MKLSAKNVFRNYMYITLTLFTVRKFPIFVIQVVCRSILVILRCSDVFHYAREITNTIFCSTGFRPFFHILSYHKLCFLGDVCQ
jgi:hypothetical protein